MVIKTQKTESDNVRYNVSLNRNIPQKHIKPSFGYEVKSPNVIKHIEKLSDSFTSADQRLLMGVTALMTQPFFDIYNKRVDEKTRIVSCTRTIGKIIAGSLTGISIRWGCIKALDLFCKTDETEAAKAAKKGVEYVKRDFKNREQWLLPDKGKEMSLKEIKKYKNAFGTLAATFIFIFTNFLIDAPLTTKIANYLTGKIENSNSAKNPEEKEAKNG